MKPLKFALFGTGFWSRYQLAAWQETGRVECIALCNRTRSRAEEVAQLAGLNVAIYEDPQELLEREQPEFVDIVTSADKHGELVRLAAGYGIPVICQKPMALSLDEAESLVNVCSRSAVPFYIHENWRWQRPLRKLKEILDNGTIGSPYRARIRMVSGFPVFENQPSLKDLERFLIVDVGSHILDVVRFLLGEPESLYCTTMKVQRDVKGEDVATVMLRMANGLTVICEMGYPGAPLEMDFFPQTFAFVEGDGGSVHLGPNYWLRITNRAGVQNLHCPPPSFAWADPSYEVVHASIVDCHADILAGLCGERTPETTAEDNLRTMRLVFQAYESAMRNEVIRL
jgi:predicted dehydrogenase